MKEITIKIEDDVYNKIENLASWVNLNNDVKNKNKPIDYDISEIATGLLVRKVKEIDHFNALNPLTTQNVDKKATMKNRFKELAKDSSIRQVDIAETLGMNKSNLSFVFNNEKQPRMDTFLKIWVLLGCPPMHECIYFED